LQSFVAVAEELHFGRAAARLHLTSPALSQQVKLLERQLGVVLLERNNKRVALTDAGRVLLADARLLLESARAATVRLDPFRRGGVTTLRIGVSPYIPTGILSVALVDLRETDPNSPVEVHTVHQDSAVSDLVDGRLDVILVMGEPAHPGLSVVRLRCDPLGVLVHTDHWLAARADVNLEDLRGEKLVVLSTGTTLNEAGLPDYKILHEAGVQPSDVIDAGHPPQVFELVVAGMAVALTPQHRASFLPEVKWISLRGNPLAVSISAVLPARSPIPAAELLVKLLKLQGSDRTWT
jgi:DNA-binding transcriptional LysR family regulator